MGSTLVQSGWLPWLQGLAEFIDKFAGGAAGRHSGTIARSRIEQMRQLHKSPLPLIAILINGSSLSL